LNIAIATDTNGSSQDTAAKATSTPSPLRKLIRLSAVDRSPLNYINKVYLSDIIMGFSTYLWIIRSNDKPTTEHEGHK